MTQYAIGDEVQILVKLPNQKYDVTERTSKVEGMTNDGFLVVRPKHFRETVEIDVGHVKMLKAIKRNRAQKLLGAKKIMEEVSIGGYGNLPVEARELLEQVSDVIQDKIGTKFGKTTLFWGLIHEVNRHIDTKEVKRG